MRRWVPALIAVLTVFLGGCGKTYVEVDITAVSSAPEPETTVMEIITTTEPETTAEETIEEPEERVEVDGKIKSYLTGEMLDVEKADRRPVAVMMSNDKEARPQYGINRAGVVYEAPVEGVMNRYMAIIEDYDDLERIGSVRSCRTYYIYFAKEFDAIYAHFGQSTFAKPYLSEVDNINGIEGVGSSAFYRSSDKKAPHNAYTSFEKLQAAMDKLGYSQEYHKDYEGHYQFARNGEELTPEPELSLSAFRVVPGYPYNEPYFEYNEEDGLYYRYQYGGPHNGDEGQIAVKNILFQYCPIGHYASTQYLNIGLDEPQYGYYITNGRAIPINWEKEGPFGVTHYYNTEKEEITLNQGKTWVCIISAADFSKSEIHGKDDESNTTEN
ncbi:MAG: DUF3048 domain-containing protein [Hungatella sp.]|nr:DUF3048 domain-containing protein [Hungatella sp.]